MFLIYINILFYVVCLFFVFFFNNLFKKSLIFNISHFPRHFCVMCLLFHNLVTYGPFLCLSQAGNWTSNVIFRGGFLMFNER